MKYKIFLLIFVLAGSVGFVPYAHAVTSGCYSQGSDTIIQPINGVCPDGTSGVGTNGAGGTAANGNLSYTSLEPLPGQSSNQTNFCGLLNLLFKVLIYLGAMVAVLYLVLSGITYMVSEVVTKRTKANKRTQAAIYGLLILLGSWIILNTVNPQLVAACNVLGPANANGVVNGNIPLPPAFADDVACGSNSGRVAIPGPGITGDPNSPEGLVCSAARNGAPEYTQALFNCAPIAGTNRACMLHK